MLVNAVFKTKDYVQIFFLGLNDKILSTLQVLYLMFLKFLSINNFILIETNGDLSTKHIFNLRAFNLYPLVHFEIINIFNISIIRACILMNEQSTNIYFYNF